MEELKYPIGKFQYQDQISDQQISDSIEDIAAFPKLLNLAVSPFSETQLNWRYRPDGWTVRQVVHHCADSHLNSISRFKLALTERNPTIKPYDQSEWAKLADIDSPVSYSLHFLEALHVKWVYLLKKLGPEDHRKTYFHPEAAKTIRLDQTICLYAWHGKHHLAHIKLAEEAAGKY